MSWRLKTIRLVHGSILHRNELLKPIVDLFLPLPQHSKEWHPTHGGAVSHTVVQKRTRFKGPKEQAKALKLRDTHWGRGIDVGKAKGISHPRERVASTEPSARQSQAGSGEFSDYQSCGNYLRLQARCTYACDLESRCP